MIYDGDIVDISQIKNNYEKYNKNYYDLNNLKINYFSLLYKNYGENCELLSFWNLRYFHINLSQQIKELSIPYVYMCYYKEEVDLINRNDIYHLKENFKNTQLYIYFFFQLMYQIFKIFDNTYICLNEGLNLGLSKKNMKKNKENEIASKLKYSRFSNCKTISDFCTYVESYKGSKLENIKEDYRNKYTHDFINSIPRAVLNKLEINYQFFDINQSFKDMLCLLKILEEHLEKIEGVIKIYINYKGLS